MPQPLTLRLRRGLDWLEASSRTLCGAAIAIVFAAMVIVGGLQIFNRFVLNVSLSWSEEFQRYSQAWLVFLAVPLAYSRGMHVGMEFLSGRLPAPVKRVLSTVIDLTWGGLGIVLIASGSHIVSMGTFQRSPGLHVPMGVVHSAIVLSGAYILLIAAIRLARLALPDPMDAPA
jgi:TRAP-type C4-dicarboxylate transport system permease small subunit